MEWQGRRESDNVEDRRGGGLKTVGALGGGGIIIAIIYALLGGDPRVILDQINTNQVSPDQGTENRTAEAPNKSSAGAPKDARDDAEKSFVSVVLADTEDVWGTVFEQLWRTYTKPKLVLYDGRVQSACGLASSAVGPFYCPGDQQVYLDLSFFKELQTKLGAQGEFARAYVIAHEIGHHVQNLLGETDLGGRRPSNQQSVAIELAADCYAGVWAKVTDQAKHVLEKGDIESAVSAAAAVGDDRLQRESGHAVAPDAFTHGSSMQRVAAFKRGFAGGDPGDCRATGVAH